MQPSIFPGTFNNWFISFCNANNLILMEQPGWSNSNSHVWKLKRDIGSAVVAHPWYLHVESLQTPRCSHCRSATCAYRNICKTVYIWIEQKRKKGKIVYSGNHCCSLALTTNAASFWTWVLSLRSRKPVTIQRTSSPPSEVTQLEVGRHKTRNYKKYNGLILGFSLCKKSHLYHTQKKSIQRDVSVLFVIITHHIFTISYSVFTILFCCCRVSSIAISVGVWSVSC